MSLVSHVLYLCFQPISAIINPPVPDPGAFLRAHLRKDMEHLIRSLGKGTDDTVSAVHLLISNLMEPKQQQTCKQQQTYHSTLKVLCANDTKNKVIVV